MLKVKSRLFKFGEQSIGGDWVDEPSFRRVLSSDRVKKNLADKILLGSISHKRRDDALDDKKSLVPLGDWLMAEGSVALTISDMWIDEDEKACYSVLEILDTPEGKTVQTLIEQGVKLRPSIVFNVKDAESKKMDILDILGVDLTTIPAFDTTFEVVQ